MKKSAILVIVFLVVIVLGVLVYGVSVKSDVEEDIDSTAGSFAEEQTGIVSAPEVQEPEEYQIFNPILTYEGFYNGPLYATSEQIGDGYDIDKYMANLDKNGVNFFIGMFPILGGQSEDSLIINSNLGYVINNVKEYPHRIIPFFNPGYGGGEIEEDKLYGDELTSLYSAALISSKSIAGDNLIRGFGEVETQEWNIGHNDPRVLQLVNLASSNNINFMFHPVAQKISDVENIIEEYPNTNFLIHLFRDDLNSKRAEWIELMKNHDNLYFSIDAAHIIHYNGNDILYDYYDSYGENAASRFISTVNSNYNVILNDAVSDYKPLVQAVPDKVMWGTEAGPDYSFEPEVYDLMIKVSRDFISKVSDNLEQQEALGYKNALRVFGQGAVLDREINVEDTGSWPLCTDEQLERCEFEICGLQEGEDDLSPEQEECFNSCLFEIKCIDPLA